MYPDHPEQIRYRTLGTLSRSDIEPRTPCSDQTSTLTSYSPFITHQHTEPFAQVVLYEYTERGKRSGTELLSAALSWTSFTLELSPQEFTGDSPEKAAARTAMAGAQAALKQIEDDEVGLYNLALSNLSCNHLKLSSYTGIRGTTDSTWH